MGSRIKTTDAPVVFTARGEVLLMSKRDKSKRNEYYKTSDRSELAIAKSRAYEQEESRWDHQYKQQAENACFFFCFQPFSSFECLFFKNSCFGKFYEPIIATMQ